MENAQRFYLTLLNVAVLIVAMIAVVWIMFSAPSVENNALIALFSSVVGALVMNHSNSQSWWFSTSKGTSDTTAVLRDIATGRPPPVNPDVPTTDPTGNPPPLQTGAPPKSEFATQPPKVDP